MVATVVSTMVATMVAATMVATRSSTASNFEAILIQKSLQLIVFATISGKPGEPGESEKYPLASESRNKQM